MRKLLNKIAALTLTFSLLFEQTGSAQTLLQIQIPAYIGGYVAEDRFRPAQLRSLSFDPSQQDFIKFLDQGDLEKMNPGQISQEAKQLMQYFWIGLALPNESFWVNLRPDAPDQIIDPFLEKTDVGRIMLAADLQLKKDLAVFTSPNNQEGRQYWDKLYAKAETLFAGQEISIPTLTRPWIVPGEIIVRETNSSCHILKASLKVCLEQDHIKDSKTYNFSDPRLKELNDFSFQLVRDLILPKLTREVNSSRKYAALRQVYYSLVLAQWFKEKHQGRQGEYCRKIDSLDLNGLVSAKRWDKKEYFNAYKRSFKKGEYNLAENRFTVHGPSIRQYFSGGMKLVLTPGTKIVLSPDPEIAGADEQLPSGLVADLVRVLPENNVRLPFQGGGLTREQLDEKIRAALNGDKEAADVVRAAQKDNPRLFREQVEGLSEYYSQAEIESLLEEELDRQAEYLAERIKYWMQKGFKQSEAYILASAELVKRFSPDGAPIALHQSWLREKDVDELLNSLEENHTGNYELIRKANHEFIALIDLDFVMDYEFGLKQCVESRLEGILQPEIAEEKAEAEKNLHRKPGPRKSADQVIRETIEALDSHDTFKAAADSLGLTTMGLYYRINRNSRINEHWQALKTERDRKENERIEAIAEIIRKNNQLSDAADEAMAKGLINSFSTLRSLVRTNEKLRKVWEEKIGEQLTEEELPGQIEKKPPSPSDKVIAETIEAIDNHPTLTAAAESLGLTTQALDSRIKYHPEIKEHLQALKYARNQEEEEKIEAIAEIIKKHNKIKDAADEAIAKGLVNNYSALRSMVRTKEKVRQAWEEKSGEQWPAKELLKQTARKQRYKRIAEILERYDGLKQALPELRSEGLVNSYSALVGIANQEGTLPYETWNKKITNATDRKKSNAGKDGGATQAPDDTGGVDFRAMPVNVPLIGVVPGASAVMPKVSLKELDDQWKDIQHAAQNAQLPYEQMKQFVSCCQAQEEAAGLKQEVIAYVVNLLKLEEERAIATPDQLKEIVALIVA